MKSLSSLVSVLCLALAASTAAAEEAQITAGGSSTVRPVLEQAARAFEKVHPGVRFAIGGGGSSQGVKLVASDRVMIGMASRDLYAKESDRWSDLVQMRIGLDGIALVVNTQNSVDKITKQQVQQLFTGELKSWKELGGPDNPVTLVSKEEGRSTLDLFLEYFGLEAKQVESAAGKQMVHRRKGSQAYSEVGARLIGPNRVALAAVARHPNAIAYVSVGTAQEVATRSGRVRLLELDGVAATVENVANESYPLRRPLTLVTRGKPQGLVKSFIDFISGPTGQKIVTSLEFVSAGMPQGS